MNHRKFEIIILLIIVITIKIQTAQNDEPQEYGSSLMPGDEFVNQTDLTSF